jgi:transcriptional regulator GlxA family with amidase domain
MSAQHVVIVAFAGCQLLDVSGPASVFSAAGEVPGARSYRVTVVSPAGGEVTTGAGVILATQQAASVPPSSVDLLLIVGGSPEGLAVVRADQRLASWARDASSHAARFGSVCTGAFVIAAWGLADGRTVATHWAAAARLARRYPQISVDPIPLFVEDGKLWTSAGVTAGIDMALAMVAHDEGDAVAAAVARRIVLPLRRSGNQAQHSRLLEAQAGGGGRYADLIAWLAENLHQRLAAGELASRAGESERSFQRRFRAATGHSPAAFLTRLRLERARDLLSAGRTVKEAARACGFASADRLSRAFASAYGAAPSALRPGA